jgi:hypothetical protein
LGLKKFGIGQFFDFDFFKELDLASFSILNFTRGLPMVNLTLGKSWGLAMI